MKLEKWRIKNDVSQGELARRLNTDQQRISQWEKGSMPRPNIMRAIMRLTKGAVTPNDFI